MDGCDTISNLSYSSNFTNINQLDGCDSISNSSYSSNSTETTESLSIPFFDETSRSSSISKHSHNNDSSIFPSDDSFISNISEHNIIPVIVGNRIPTSQNANNKNTRTKNALINIKSNAFEKSVATLPIISVINARSLWPKLKNFAAHFKENDIQLSIITEIWGKGSKKDLYKIQELLEIKGIDLLFDIRKDKRGGGTAVAVCSESFSMCRVNLSIPKGVEMTVVKIKSKRTDVITKPLIVFSIYSSPRSKYNNDLINFLMMQIPRLKTMYPRASFILGGDRNSIPLDNLSNLYPGIHQIVTEATRKHKILDFLSTDLHSLYQVPIITDSLGPDDPTKAKPSDHKIPIATPKCTNLEEKGKITITKRPMTESNLSTFGNWIASQTWEEMETVSNIDQLSNMFLSKIQTKIDELFPTVTTRVPKNNKPWFNHKLRELSKKKKSIFKKEGRSNNYKDMVKQFNVARKTEIRKYLDKTISTVTRRNSPDLHKALKQLSSAPGDVDTKHFFLEEHSGLASSEIAEDLAVFFSSISKEYAPISENLLPNRVLEKLNLPYNLCEIPKIEPYQVYNRIKKMKIPSSTVPQDFPPRIWKNFAPELATPVSIIINKILSI